jgi:hypothetical protein
VSCRNSISAAVDGATEDRIAMWIAAEALDDGLMPQLEVEVRLAFRAPRTA